MVGRPVNERRRAELLDAVVDHAAEHGFAELSWRTLATAVGVSPTTLVHHFGTREQLLAAVLDRLCGRVGAATGDLGAAPDLAAATRTVWATSSDPAQASTFRLFFAVLGAALQAPELYADFLVTVRTGLTADLVAVQGPGVDPATAARRASLVLATTRGLLLELLGGGDPGAVHLTAEEFAAGLAPR